MGWDDNGLNVERRVQILTGTRCDPSLPYDPDFRPPEKVPRRTGPSRSAGPTSSSCAARSSSSSSRRTSTCGPTSACRSTGRQTLPHHRARGHPRQPARRSSACSTATWPTGPRRPRCGTSTSAPRSPRPSCRTARSRAPTTRSASTAPTARRSGSTRPGPSCCRPASRSSPTPTTSATSRCSARQARTPLFGVEVPIVAHELAAPDKGTGIAMICTFGDTTDVTWWRELDLDLRAVVQRDGRLRSVTWGEPGWESADAGAAQAAYDELAGQARPSRPRPASSSCWPRPG